MRPASKRLFSILISLGFLIGAIVAFSSLVAPAYEEIQQLRGEKKSLDAAVREEEELVGIASRLISEYRSASNLRENLSLILPMEEAVPGIINQIQGIARTTGVTIEGINVEPLPLDYSETDSAAQPAGSFKTTVRLRGNYESLKSYVQSLETNARIIDVDSFVISGGGTSGPLQTSIVLRTYYQR